MLRPYLTVIRDSFRAAMNSRVLYIVLALIVLVLLLLAPLHVRETIDWKLTSRDSLPSPERLVQRLVDDGKSGNRAAVAHIWNLLSPEVQADLEKEAAREPAERPQQEGPGPNPLARRLMNEFNDLLENGELYDEKAFQGKRLGEEAKTLVDKGTSRSTDEDRRLNRLLLSTALRRDVAMPGDTQLDFYYLFWHWSDLTTNTSHSQFASTLTNQLPAYFDKFIVSIGIFIAILITASIIPEMLEPGSLNLLLSKPVTRWGLLLAKYVGGCVFILMCASLLFVGLWLWMGIQLGVWENTLLWSIPIYVFVFAMYYSISVLTGVMFRSPILCITFALLFWGICSAIGYAYAWLDYRHYNEAPLQMVALNDDVVLVNIIQQNFAWDENDKKWRNPSNRDIGPEESQILGFGSFFDRFDEFPDLPGPAIDTETNRILFTDNGFQEMMSQSKLKVASTDPADRWKTGQRGRLPTATAQFFFSPRLGQLAVDQSGSVYRWTGTETSADSESKARADGKNDTATKKISDQLSGLVKRGTNKLEYEKIGGEEVFVITTPSSVSLNPENDEIAFYSKGDLVILAVDNNGNYKKRTQKKVGDHSNRQMTAFVSYRGDNIFVILGNGRFYHLSADGSGELARHDLSDQAAVRGIAASPDGNYVAMALRSGELWIYDAVEKHPYSKFGVPKTDVLATTFDNRGRLWVGDRFRVARAFDLSSGKEVSSREPASGWFTRAFRYAIRPLYRIFPKPGEFYKLISELSSSGDARGNPDVDLTKLTHRDNPWSPLQSGIIFTALVLALTCLIFQRQDF